MEPTFPGALTRFVLTRGLVVRRPEMILIFTLTLLLAGSVHAGTITLPAVHDNTLFASATGHLSNGAGPAIFVGNNSGSLTHRALLRFDPASHMPDGATLISAELRVYVSNAPNEVTRTVSVHRVLSGWGEGASSSSGGGGAPAETGDATWIHTYSPDSLWTTPGGDFDAAVSASGAIGDVGFYSWSGPGLTKDVEAWLRGDAPDFGWILLGNEAEASTARRIDSRESDVPAQRPVLVLTIDAPYSIEIETWSGLKSRFRNGVSP